MVGSGNSTFLQNSEIRKHKKPKIQLFTFLNHQKTQNYSSFFGFTSCAVNLKKVAIFFKSARVFSSLSNLGSHVNLKMANYVKIRMAEKIIKIKSSTLNVANLAMFLSLMPVRVYTFTQTRVKSFYPTAWVHS